MSRFRWRPTREGFLWVVCACIMLAAGLIKTINLLILIGYLMFGLVGLNAWLAWRSAHRVSVARAIAIPGFAGREAVRAAIVTNDADKGASITILETSAIHSAEVFVPALLPNETRRISTTIHPQVRGRYATSPISIIAGYPFGLIEYILPAEPSVTLTVLPAIGLVHSGKLRRWLIRTGAGDNHIRRPLRRQSNQGADVRGVRAYRPGDSPRDIHWRTTARRNELMVREYDSTEPLDVLMVVEVWVPPAPTAADIERAEAALSLAASVFWSWCHSEEQPEATLVLAGSKIWRSGRASDGFGLEALGLLADAPLSNATHLLPLDALRRRSNRCARLLITSNPSTTLAMELNSATGVPFVCVGPASPMAWYEPPVSGNAGTKH